MIGDKVGSELESCQEIAMNTARWAWILGSLFVNVTIIIYIFLSAEAPTEMTDRHNYINEHWHIYSLHWKFEFIFMTLIAIGAFYFAVRLTSISWSVVSIGQLILLPLYPMMLGGYNSTAFEISEAINQIAWVIFLFGNIVFLLGLFFVYRAALEIPRVLSIVAMSFTGIAALVFFAAYIGIISQSSALMAGPIINIIYLINAYYGFKIELGNPPNTQIEQV